MLLTFPFDPFSPSWTWYPYLPDSQYILFGMVFSTWLHIIHTDWNVHKVHVLQLIEHLAPSQDEDKACPLEYVYWWTVDD